MKIQRLADRLGIQNKYIKLQAIKCDHCNEIATVSIAHEFSSQVDFLCKECQEKTTLGSGSIVSDFSYYVDSFTDSDKPIIETTYEE